MMSRSALALCGALLAVGVPGAAAAQDAAETAQILAGTGQSQGGAARSLGGNISQSMNAASNAVRAARSGDAPASGHRAAAAPQPFGIPENVDFLEGTDAPTYRLGNGASIRVSGGLIAAPATTCVKDCPAARAKRR